MRHFFGSLLVFLLTILPAHAQDTLHTPSEPPEWGEVSPQTLRVDDYPADSNASAVIISDYGDGYFRSNGEIAIDYHTRIKILDESGYEAGTVTIPYYAEDGIQDIDDVEGQTYTLNGGTVETHELSDDDVFQEDVDGKYEQIRFTLPKLEAGAVIEYRYELESESWLRIPSWSFQHAHPTLYSEYEVRIPSFLEFVAIKTGSQNYESVEKEEHNSDMGVEVEKSWVMTDVPALREEPYMTTPDDYRSRLRFQARALRNPRTGAVMERFMTSWPSLAETQMEADYFGNGLGEKTGGFLQGENVLRKKIKHLTGDVQSDSAKMHILYDYVRSTVKWNGKLRRGRENDFDDIFTSKVGNSAEVNLLLVSMLQLAGVEAHPVMISTREHGKVFPLYPIANQFNSVIAAVELPDKKERVLLDATEPLCPPSMLPKRDLNRQGWLVRKGNPSWIQIEPPAKTGRRLFVQGRLQPDGTLKGKVTVRDRGYSALSTRRALQDEDPSAFLADSLLSSLTNLSLSDVSVANQDTVRRPLRATATFESPGYARSMGNMMYVNPRLVPAANENPFKRKERSFPVDFAHPQRHQYILTLGLPDGYQVKATPKNRRVKLPNDKGTFTSLIQVGNGRLMVRSTLEITASRIPPARYKALRELYSRVVSAQSEQIVLEKKDTGAVNSSSGDRE